MNISLFYHSLLSDWNHGNAHFLRGVVSELLSRGHEVTVYEPRDAWSLANLLSEHGPGPIHEFAQVYPGLAERVVRYDPTDFSPAQLDDADLVLVHEWNAPDLVHTVGQHRAQRGRYCLLFHDTHHRAVTDPSAMARYDLTHYDGVLAFGDILRRIYLQRRWIDRAFTWHEAADPRVFYPRQADHDAGDLVWVGNWGDDERTAELHEFLLTPVQTLGLRARVFGVRYPDAARAALRDAGIDYGGWLPNFAAPGVFARYGVTVHVPRRPYVQALPGIPTIRVFEALACGMPLVCSPWDDAERLFEPGRDFLTARDGPEMTQQLARVVTDRALARRLADHGRATILARHTCAHRVDELLSIQQAVVAEPRPRHRPMTLTSGRSS